MSTAKSLLLALSLASAGWSGTQAVPASTVEDLLLEIHVATPNIEFGQAFVLTVRRAWNRNLTPETWDDGALSPLVLRPIETTRRNDALRIEETRRFHAFLFRHGKVTIPATAFRARPRNGGLMREVFSDAFTLSVNAGLDPADIGPIEVLELLPLPASAWFGWPAAGLLVLAGMSFLAYSFTRRGGGKTLSRRSIQSSIDPHDRASERLRALRTQQPVGDDENRAFYVEASDILRSYIEDRFTLRARRMTTDEFLEAEQTLRALQAAERSILSGFLTLCDLAKFAGQQPGASARARCLDAAAAFLSTTQPIAEPGDAT